MPFLKLNQLPFLQNGRFALSVDDQWFMRLWDMATGKEIRIFNGRSFFNTVTFFAKWSLCSIWKRY